ncbi:sensory transduction histidine kinase [Rhodopirellula maiorica SM1]|uniref:histidine kinase n=1 Tax=Rhodopirellula maiorica SM1 TaxID=1265738 RepID=M5R8F2_9BACT|nr:PAS domain-containing hybrid sensor histidine kinase/response regulator [Rhodopirellula maiorica]EMI15758.1 sensory transduction histidine kinase [Rhodopirellula maiorica SM1]
MQQTKLDDERLRLALSLAEVGVLDIDYQSDTIVADLKAAELFDIPMGQAISRSVLWDRVHPEDRAELELAWDEASFRDSEFAAEYRVVHDNGEVQCVSVREKAFAKATPGAERHDFGVLVVRDTSTAQRDDDASDDSKNQVDPHAVAGDVGSANTSPIRDPLESEFFQRAHQVADTNRKLRETLQKLRESESRLLMAAETTGFGTYEYNIETQRSVWSSQLYRIFGIEEGTPLIGSKLLNHIHVKDRDRFLRLYHKAIQPGASERHSIQFRIVRPDGEVRWVVDSGRVLFDDDEASHKSRRLIGTLQDITEQKDFEQSLKRARRVAEAANRSRGEFLANMSHEIRTPMTAILGHADILKDHLRDPDNVQAVETIRRNGAYLLEIINDILDLSKIDAGKLEIERERIQLDSLVADIRSLMDVRAKEKELPLLVEFEGLIPEMIETDAVRLRQILLNLLGNAIKFTDRGKIRLVVRYVSAEERIQFDVIDTGIGISPEILSTLFQPFQQADNSSTRSFGGTGLGLAISRRLAQALGGDVTVQSRFGHGSTFSVTIHVGGSVKLVEPRLDISANDESTMHHVNLNGTVLVVDDRRDIRFLAQHFIEKAGGTVVTATNGQEAIEMLRSPDPPPVQVIVMDMQMPVMDGYDAARHLREHGCQLPIIALTANAMKSDRQECLDAGCTDYSTKPLDGSKLIAMIDHWMGTLHPVS